MCEGPHLRTTKTSDAMQRATMKHLWATCVEGGRLQHTSDPMLSEPRTLKGLGEKSDDRQGAGESFPHADPTTPSRACKLCDDCQGEKPAMTAVR